MYTKLQQQFTKLLFFKLNPPNSLNCLECKRMIYYFNTNIYMKISKRYKKEIKICNLLILINMYLCKVNISQNLYLLHFVKLIIIMLKNITSLLIVTNVGVASIHISQQYYDRLWFLFERLLISLKLQKCRISTLEENAA